MGQLNNLGGAVLKIEAMYCSSSSFPVTKFECLSNSAFINAPSRTQPHSQMAMHWSNSLVGGYHARGMPKQSKFPTLCCRSISLFMKQRMHPLLRQETLASSNADRDQSVHCDVRSLASIRRIHNWVIRMYRQRATVCHKLTEQIVVDGYYGPKSSTRTYLKTA